MAAPAQIQARYVQEEDRILLRMNTVAEEEFRFWLTRRFALRLWPVLQDALFSSPIATRQTSLSARHAVVAFEHEIAKSKVGFDTGFRDMNVLPLGEAPLLITQSAFRRESDGTFFLSLHNINKQGVSLNLTSDLLHLFCKLLEDAAQHSDWTMPNLLHGVGTQLSPVEMHRLN